MPTAIGDSVDLAALGLNAPRQEQQQNELGQADFLELMITQLQNQDPFKPLESGEFLGQLAQFGTVGGLEDLNSSFQSLASSLVSDQALQAAALVGHSVLAEGDVLHLEPGTIASGAIDVPTGTSSVSLQISDASGGLIRQIDLGAQSSGLVRYQWGGETDDGLGAAAGNYRISAQYFRDNQMNSAPTLVEAQVQSVIFGAQGVEVKLEGLGDVPFSLVREIS